MSATIPQNCTWVGGISPADAPEAGTALATIEAVNARIRWHLDQVGLLRTSKTKLHRIERAAALTAIKRDFEAGMSRPAICRKYRITLGQLVGCANRGGWKCEARKSGRKAVVADEQLPALKAAYENERAMLKVIAGRFGIDRSTLCRYATRGGWVRIRTNISAQTATAMKAAA